MKQRVSLSTAAHALARQLRRQNKKIVFAESCTAGLCAATLSRIPGISSYLCGSLVVYRNATKVAYLGIDGALLEKVDAVSRETAQAMVESALSRTPEADLAVSITGHLGPGSPAGLDGVVFIGAQRRGETTIVTRLVHPLRTRRVWRQRASVVAVYRIALGLLG
jgi:nicotinamide-nucleotide amidase